jgi:CBS domain-containing protein
MKLEKIMSRDLVFVAPRTDLIHAARLMREHDISSVLVVDDTASLVGILTEQDLARRVVAEALAPYGLEVGAFMTRDPVTAQPGDEVWEGAGRMRLHGVRHLPIVEGSRPVGMVSIRDVVGMESPPAGIDVTVAGRHESSRERTIDVPEESAISLDVVTAWF